MLVGPLTGANAGLLRSTGDDASAGALNMTHAISVPPSVTRMVLDMMYSPDRETRCRHEIALVGKLSASF
jgi:hypothetical protein